MSLFSTAPRISSVSLKGLPFLSHDQVFSCEISSVSPFKWPYICFSFHSYFLVVFFFFLFCWFLCCLCCFELSDNLPYRKYVHNGVSLSEDKHRHQKAGSISMVLFLFLIFIKLRLVQHKSDNLGALCMPIFPHRKT